MRPSNVLLSAFILVLVTATGCEPVDKVSDIPEIKFKSLSSIYEIVDTLGGFDIKAADLLFSFADGDANFGAITGSRDTVNLVLEPYKKVNHEYFPVSVDTFGRKYAIMRVEELDRVGQNKTVKGDIKVQIQYFTVPPFDTIRYDFYILDRAGNKSNVESTSDIGF
jgi:hypothetical protein